MSTGRRFQRLAAAAIAWLILVALSITVPSVASATEHASTDASELFGQRMTTGAQVASEVRGFAIALAERPEICDTIPDAGPACDTESPDTGAPDEPVVPDEPTVAPRDPYEDAAESAASAKAAAIASLEEPHWVIHPPDDRQLVGLQSFLYIEDNFDSTTSQGALVGDQQVFVTAEPIRSQWSFTEKDTGARSSVSCAGRGSKWSPGATDPACGKRYFHSSDVTGKVELEVCVLYSVRWDHEYASGNESHTECSTSPGELTVLEVMTWGIDQLDAAATTRPSAPVVHEPKIQCNWKSTTVAWVLPGVGCEPIQRIGELIGNFLDGCGGSIISKFTDLWDVIAGFGSDPVGYVKEQIAGLQAMYDQLANPETRMAMIETLGREALYLPEQAVMDTWTTDDWARWSGEAICGFAFDYLSGNASGKIFEYLSSRIDLPATVRLKRPTPTYLTPTYLTPTYPTPIHRRPTTPTPITQTPTTRRSRPRQPRRSRSRARARADGLPQ